MSLGKFLVLPFKSIASFSPQAIHVLGTLERFYVFIQFIKNVIIMVLKISFYFDFLVKMGSKVSLGEVTIMFVT